MIKEALEYLVGLGKPGVVEVDGQAYSYDRLIPILPPSRNPDILTVHGLDSIAQLVKAERGHYLQGKIFLEVQDERTVRAFTEVDYESNHIMLYRAELRDPCFMGGWMERESALSLLEELCLESEGRARAIEIISEARAGNRKEIRERVELTPYRTFREVAQPKSWFTIWTDGNRVGLREADARVWVLQAKLRIKEHLEESLAQLVQNERVVVMM